MKFLLYLCTRFRKEASYRASPIRPAPSELPQALTGARVRGCSGAM